MVRMYHDDPVETGGPVTADVPEEAVPWMQKKGWYLKSVSKFQAKEEEPKPKRAVKVPEHTD